jgi:hypothetical protein
MAAVGTTGQRCRGMGYPRARANHREAGHYCWLVPAAALASHLCIGMAYGCSVFWLPRSIGIYSSPDPIRRGYRRCTPRAATWRVVDLAPDYMLFIFLGSSAALWGGWVERVGPRKAGVIAAFWCGGLVISAVVVIAHQALAHVAGLWRHWRRRPRLHLAGIDPGEMVPRPARHATGMAIMGFGGGTMIGSPLAETPINQFRTPARSAPCRPPSRCNSRQGRPVPGNRRWQPQRA